MPAIRPISRRKLVKYLGSLGFEGPLPGGRHEYMFRGKVQVIIPNPHKGDISREFLLEILKEAGVSREEWEKL